MENEKDVTNVHRQVDRHTDIQNIVWISILDSQYLCQKSIPSPPTLWHFWWSSDQNQGDGCFFANPTSYEVDLFNRCHQIYLLFHHNMTADAKCKILIIICSPVRSVFYFLCTVWWGLPILLCTAILCCAGVRVLLHIGQHAVCCVPCTAGTARVTAAFDSANNPCYTATGWNSLLQSTCSASCCKYQTLHWDLHRGNNQELLTNEMHSRIFPQQRNCTWRKPIGQL